MIDQEQTKEDDDLLFKKLDTHLNKLRNAADDLLTNVLMKPEMPHKELTGLCNALKKIKSSSIQKMDEAIIELNQQAQLASIKMNELVLMNKGAKSPNEELGKQILLKCNELVKEAINLAKIAMDLNKGQK